MPQQTELLERGSYQLGLELNARQLEQFQAYYRELADWNRRVNLTAVTEYREVQVKHFLDSLSLYSVCAGGPTDGLKVVDVGAGAGFPGLPLKLALPDIQLTLVESVGKKARFLEHLVRALGLSGVDVLTGRAEALAHDAELRESFDLAVSRGVAKLPVLLEYTLPFCRIGGRAALLKRNVEREVAGAASALEALGGRMGTVYPVQLQALDDGRVIVTVDKAEATHGRYPRRPGMPVKRPL